MKKQLVHYKFQNDVDFFIKSKIEIHDIKCEIDNKIKDFLCHLVFIVINLIKKN